MGTGMFALIPDWFWLLLIDVLGPPVPLRPAP
jgi:hypothetical protein